jgi:hypothetical protein
VSAPAHQRPSYISIGLEGIGEAHPSPEPHGDGFELRGWRAVAEHGSLKVDGTGDAADWWRVVAAAAWRHLDETGQGVDTSTTTVPR